MDELRELEQKAWLALQRGHYKMFGKLAAKWHKINKANALNGNEWLLDPFLSLRNVAEKVRV